MKNIVFFFMFFNRFHYTYNLHEYQLKLKFRKLIKQIIVQRYISIFINTFSY